MNDFIISREREIALGAEHQKTWDALIEPFFEAKQAELFDIFITAGATDKEGLFVIHQQSQALESLRDNFLHFINTGKIAQRQLQEIEERQDG